LEFRILGTDSRRINMSATLRLPPSGRDFFVYERIVVDLVSTRQVAEEADISQTRVRQIVRRVIEWLGETLPEETELSQAKQLRVGRQIAADRLEAHYREAARKWRSTEQPKFAGLAIRILAAQVRLPVVAGKYEALMADVLEGPLPEEQEPLTKSKTAERRRSKVESREQLTKGSTFDPAPFVPPEADCSAIAAEATSESAAAAFTSAVASSAEPTCDELTAEARAARAAFFAPAQSAHRDDAEAPSTLKITPEELGLSTRRPLTRKERRRRQRALAAK
jgi:hypothetical protein